MDWRGVAWGGLLARNWSGVWSPWKWVGVKVRALLVGDEEEGIMLRVEEWRTVVERRVSVRTVTEKVEG